MALDLLLTCLALQITLLVSTVERSVSVYMSMSVMGTAVNSGVVGNSLIKLRPWTTLSQEAGEVRVRLVTLLPLARLVTGGRTTN